MESVFRSRNSCYRGYHERRRCLRGTYSESDISKYTCIQRSDVFCQYRVWMSPRHTISENQIRSNSPSIEDSGRCTCASVPPRILLLPRCEQLCLSFCCTEKRIEGLSVALSCRNVLKGARNVQWFQGGLVCEAHRLLYHSA